MFGLTPQLGKNKSLLNYSGISDACVLTPAEIRSIFDNRKLLFMHVTVKIEVLLLRINIS